MVLEWFVLILHSQSEVNCSLPPPSQGSGSLACGVDCSRSSGRPLAAEGALASSPSLAGLQQRDLPSRERFRCALADPEALVEEPQLGASLSVTGLALCPSGGRNTASETGADADIGGADLVMLISRRKKKSRPETSARHVDRSPAGRVTRPQCLQRDEGSLSFCSSEFTFSEDAVDGLGKINDVPPRCAGLTGVPDGRRARGDGVFHFRGQAGSPSSTKGSTSTSCRSPPSAGIGDLNDRSLFSSSMRANRYACPQALGKGLR
ncbi:hypothetical protein AAFF_G00280300 [Aldrovandia affinis]|uniref:Uncharacterized protein n=1 Tax=Aldrovandia affinis TaxID=143900 RepID=A0AAD7RA13_9TELE|nr:hypothetical protein AAFF_G00280300 [Aldrovandia affinis]